MKRRETLSFEPGTLSVRISGYGAQNYSAELIFDWSLVDHRPNEEDSGSHIAIDLPHSELIAIRDFLNRVIPLALADDEEPAPVPMANSRRLEGCLYPDCGCPMGATARTCRKLPKHPWQP